MSDNWPCHSKPREQWCDRDGSGGFMGHTCKISAELERKDELRREGRRALSSAALADVAAERCRQIEAEGFNGEHDDEHESGEMALAAACYASPVPIYEQVDGSDSITFKDPWPWHDIWDKRPRDDDVLIPAEGVGPATRRRCLVKAAALIVAEIERLDRAAATKPAEPASA